MDDFSTLISALEKNISSSTDKKLSYLRSDLHKAIDNLYTQVESVIWLNKRLSLKAQLPPLRGWPVSPDFLLKLHTWIRKNKPKIIVETGSGSSTLVIADALRQNGFGKLYSFEHLEKYANQTYETLDDEHLTPWVELRVGSLEVWEGPHLNPTGADPISKWYPLNLAGIEGVDLLLVDGPPGNTCQYARYPAVPAFIDRLSPNAQVWMDDANRQDEKDVCEHWAENYGFNLEFFPLEKGLGLLTRK
ncbi:class I SAM-dependent methyltransferase [Halomonas sp. DWK9]|uniref:O-methyltransferase n=1 Tax=Halomonas sp. DWK9 TaxID=3060155 RepID=UPI00287FA6B6|nr:class I SAM-dependent methyltransferase [Halomonas sp. DWK9]